MVRRRGEERLADPDEVVLRLLLERHPRPHSGMDEGVVAVAGHQREALEEIRHPRHRSDQPVAQRPPRLRVGVIGQKDVVDAEGPQRRAAPVHHPEVEVRPLGRAQEVAHELVVVAEQELGPAARRVLHGDGERARRFGAAVDVVADMDHPPVLRRPPPQIAADPEVHLGEQVGPPVHVADGVEPEPLGGAGLGQHHHPALP